MDLNFQNGSEMDPNFQKWIRIFISKIRTIRILRAPFVFLRKSLGKHQLSAWMSRIPREKCPPAHRCAEAPRENTRSALTSKMRTIRIFENRFGILIRENFRWRARYMRPGSPVGQYGYAPPPGGHSKPCLTTCPQVHRGSYGLSGFAVAATHPRSCARGAKISEVLLHMLWPLSSATQNQPSSSIKRFYEKPKILLTPFVGAPLTLPGG